MSMALVTQGYGLNPAVILQGYAKTTTVVEAILPGRQSDAQAIYADLPVTAWGLYGPDRAVIVEERRTARDNRVYRGKVFAGVTRGLGNVRPNPDR
jgi:hypothetical protein